MTFNNAINIIRKMKKARQNRNLFSGWSNLDDPEIIALDKALKVLEEKANEEEPNEEEPNEEEPSLV